MWLVYKQKLKTVLAYLMDKKIATRHFFSGLLLGANWLIFIYAMHLGKLLEASVAYYIAPFITIAFGFLFFQERLNLNKTISVLLIVVAIAYEITRLGYLPIYAISIASSFTLYVIVRKNNPIDTISSLFMEMFFLLPIALALLGYLYLNDGIIFDLNTLDFDTVLLLFAGIVTICPLLLMGYGMSKVPLYMNAFLQYIGPTVSFFVAIILYNEPMSLERMVTFFLIWIALGLFIWDIYKQIKRFPTTKR